MLGDLAHEAWEAVRDRAEPLGEAGSGASAEQFLQEWAEPVRRQAETMLENVAQAISERDPASMSESELDQLFERFEPRDTGLEAHFENFLGGLWNKAKSFAKKAIDIAQKGIMAIPGLSGAISKLKELVKPLLDRVLRTAIDKLPAPLRPVAQQLAQRLLGLTAQEADNEGFEAAPAAPDISAVQEQFDLEAATLLFVPDVSEQELASEALYSGDGEDSAPMAALHEARAKLADDLQAGVAPEQALEQFIPIVMGVLPIARTVIGVIGRKRVVDFLAKFLATYITPYVARRRRRSSRRRSSTPGCACSRWRRRSRKTARASRPRRLRRRSRTLCGAWPSSTRRPSRSPRSLEAAVTEAFHEAAAENFPPATIVPELHEAPLRATWVPMPTGRRRKYCKKYTQVFDVEITPQIAATVTTFGGTKLAAVLKDQLGVTPPVRARVHPLPGDQRDDAAEDRAARAWCPRARREGRCGAAAPAVTVQAAGTLLQHPKLGCDASGDFLPTCGAISVGQRFYYLEIAGARPIAVSAGDGAGTAVRRTSEVNITLDFPKDEFRVFVYLSEADAQEIATKVRARDLTSVLVLAKRVYAAGVNVALGGDFQRHVKVVTHELPQGAVLRARS